MAYIVQTVFRFSKRDWALVMSAFVIGVVLPMILQSEIFLIVISPNKDYTEFTKIFLIYNMFKKYL